MLSSNELYEMTESSYIEYISSESFLETESEVEEKVGKKRSRFKDSVSIKDKLKERDLEKREKKEEQSR